MVCKWFNICPLRVHERNGSIDFSFSEKYCKSDSEWKNCKRYQMEEEGKDHSDYLLPDGTMLE
jgi:hypothetical protein